MNAETLERVFAPFETAPSGLLSDHAGAGLGLPISREIMSALRGKLWAESVPGRGSIFHLECRVNAAAPPETDEGSPWREAAEAARKAFAACAPDILVADDTEANRHVVSLLLGPHVGSVSFAHDGGQAVAMTQSRRFDAIVMDSRMPVLDGVEATRRIRATERRTGAPATPIVGLSADPPVAAEAAFRAAGADGFVAKPIHPDELIAALGEAMRAAREQTRRGEDDPAEFPLMREAMRA